MALSKRIIKETERLTSEPYVTSDHYFLEEPNSQLLLPVFPASAPCPTKTTSVISTSKSTVPPDHHTKVSTLSSTETITVPSLLAIYWTTSLTDLGKPTGGVFKLELFLTDDYPMVPPKIRFLTKIYHPNVDKLGRICLDVLKSRLYPQITRTRCSNLTDTFHPDNWSPALQIRTILLSIQALLGAPNPEDPLAADVAKSWLEDENKAITTAKEWTTKYATPAAN